MEADSSSSVLKPASDPSKTGSEPEPSPTVRETLNVSGATLSIVGDSLLIKDKSIAKGRRNICCGIPISNSSDTLTIPLYNVLWAEPLENNTKISIDYASSISKSIIRPRNVTYNTSALSHETLSLWISNLMAGAYGKAPVKRRAKVLVNPHAGPGGADKSWEHDVRPLFEAARMTLDVTTTKYSGEAVDICEKLDIDAYDTIIPCSGDGLPHEVFNGLGKRPDARKALKQIAVAHIPCGSGNAMSCNLYGTHRPSLAALAIIKGVRTPLDLVSITQGQKRYLSFLSQALGIVAESDLGTEHMRWMGAKRFDVGVLQRIFSKKVYPCDLAVKVEIEHKDGVREHYRREISGDNLNTLAKKPVDKEGVEQGEASVTGTSSASTTDNGEGLPLLKYGTVNDKLQDDWEVVSHDKLGNFYCGNMAYMAPNANFFSAACASDGLMDLVMNDGVLPAAKYLQLMTAVEANTFFDNPMISYRKVTAYRITPKDQKDGYISIDGEKVPFEPFQAEIHQALGTVISKSGNYEAPGPNGWDQVKLKDRIMA